MKENSIKNEQSSIKEAVKTMEHWIEYEKNNKDKINRADELIYIQETILSDYKRVLKENEELEEINNELEAEKNEAIRRYNFETIPIKKVKDKIEYLEDYIEENSDEQGYWGNINSDIIYGKIEILEELLEESEE